MHEYSKYFKNRLGFDRFINKLYEKYQSLSKFSGNIKLNNLTKDEALVLSRLFGNFYKEKDNITISISKFIKIMNNSKYEDFDIYTLVEEYLNISLVTKKEAKERYINKEYNFYQEIISNKDTKGYTWFKSVVDSKNPPYQIIHQSYNKNKERLRKDILNIITMIDNLPTKKVSLSIFASTYTKDPHYLDLDSRTSNLFIYALSSIDNSSYLWWSVRW